MTSSDVLDTCLAVQLARASDLLIEDIDQLLEVLKRRALEHKLTRDIVEAGRHLKIAVHDHVIIGTRGHSSLRSLGLI